MIGSAIAAAIFVLAGAALERLIGMRHRLLAGAGMTCILLFVAGAVHVPLALALAAIVLAAIAVLAMTKRVPRAERVAWPIVPTLLALVPIVWLLAVSAALPLNDYDGRAFWMLKAKAIAHERSIDGPFFHQQTTVSPRNEYPLLVPLAAALTMAAGGELDDRQARWLYVLFALAFALVLRDDLGARTTPAIGAWCAALFLWLPQILVEPDGGALSAYSDIALGAFVAAAFMELLRDGSPPRFGCWTACVLLTKNEGLPLAACLLLVAAFVFRKRLAHALAPVLVAGAALALWRSRLQRSDETDFAHVIFRLPHHAGRFADALRALLAQTVALHDWGLFGIACAASIAVLLRARERRVLLLAAGIAPPMLLLDAAVFAVTDWDLGVMRGNLAPRLITHLLGLCFALFAIALRTATRTR